jgi:8-oxo-dGTP pyrophosphatase MutT (NUDIX family)
MDVLPIIFALLMAAPQVPVGWELIPGLRESRSNPRGWALIWIAVLQGRGYEQPNIVEAPGAMVVTRDAQGRIAFVDQHRTHRSRLAEALSGRGGLGYTALLTLDALWGRLMDSHPGTVSRELPGGLVDAKDITKVGQDYEELIRRIGEREASEESGLRIKIIKVFIDIMNANPVFFLHGQSVVVAELESRGKATPDAEEAIKGRCWRTPEEIREDIRTGVIFDSRTVHALVLAGVQVN